MTDINVSVTETNVTVTPQGLNIGLINPIDLLQFNILADPPVSPSEGDMWWNAGDQTINIYIDGVTLQVGQEFLAKGVNKTGAQINDGLPLYISGASGNRPQIYTLSNNTDASAISSYFGLSTEDITNNEEGFGNVFGLVRGINTTGFSIGGAVYIDTDGTLTGTRPTTGYIVQVGIALNSTVNGTVLVIYNSHTRHDVQDVLQAATADGDMQNRQVNMWVNEDTDELTFKVKYSDGTIKSGTVSLA